MSSDNSNSQSFERDDKPRILALRLQSSILRDENVQEIELSTEVLNDESGDMATSALLGDGGKFLNDVTIRMETASQIHAFSRIPSTTLDDEDDDQNWQFLGSTLTDKRIVIQSTKDLKDLGNKARARLEEEKMKRPEIQILDQMPNSDPEKKATKKKTSFSTNIVSQQSSSTFSGKKRKLDASLHMRSIQPKPTKRSGPVTKKDNNWVPDISHIELPEKGKASAVVKLHGVPIYCTMAHVKRFFAGLRPEKIAVLLPNKSTIAPLDALNPQHRISNTIDIKLRVIVIFQSASAAILACDRSGESIVMEHDGVADEFVLAVTVLPEDIAYALSFVSVPAVPGTTFVTILKDLVGKQLHPMVDKILWSVAIRRILHDAMPMDTGIRKAEIVLDKCDEDLLLDRSKSTTWWSHPVYKRFAEHYNRLVDIQDELIHQLPYPSVDINSGTRPDQDLIVHLTTKAFKALASELDIIEKLLYQARICHL